MANRNGRSRRATAEKPLTAEEAQKLAHSKPFGVVPVALIRELGIDGAIVYARLLNYDWCDLGVPQKANSEVGQNRGAAIRRVERLGERHKAWSGIQFRRGLRPQTMAAALLRCAVDDRDGSRLFQKVGDEGRSPNTTETGGEEGDLEDSAREIGA